MAGVDGGWGAEWGRTGLCGPVGAVFRRFTRSGAVRGGSGGAGAALWAFCGCRGRGIAECRRSAPAGGALGGRGE